MFYNNSDETILEKLKLRNNDRETNEESYGKVHHGK